MPHFSPKKLFQVALSALFILAIFYLDPKGDPLASFEKNWEKSYYFESCVTGSATSSSIFDVVEVTDGDTIVISRNCEPVTVRLTGIDTPETVDPRKPVQCFGKEASAYTKERLLRTEVTIETDESQDTKDKYGRMLGYVILSDGTNFNKELIEKGYAYEYTYGSAYHYQVDFKAAQKLAMENKIGLWSDSTCSGKK